MIMSASCHVMSPQRAAVPCVHNLIEAGQLLQYYAFVEEKQKVHCLNTLFSKVPPALPLSEAM